MRENMVRARGIRLLVVIVLPLLFFSTPSAADTSKLFEKAAAEGRVAVIVGLQLPMPFIPEGAHASDVARKRQREAILDTRERFFSRLSDSFTGDYEQYAEWDSVPYVALKVNERALEHLVNNPLVTSIQEDSKRDPHLASTTAHIGADDTWSAGFGGLGWTVVILDAGIDADHPFLGGRVVDEACWSNGPGDPGNVSLCPNGNNTQIGIGSANAMTAQCWETVGNATSDNICTHGTYVTGNAAGRDPGGVDSTGYNGVAPDANIIVIQVFTRINDCDPDVPGDQPCVTTHASDHLSALDYVNNTLRSHWDISSVNMSLGGGEYESACDAEPPKVFIDNLRSNGIATVVSSGNAGWTDALGSPACVSTAIAVGSVRDTDDHVLHNMHPVVDFLSVGASIDSSIPDDTYANAGGTSAAAPQVAGAFATLKAIDPGMSVDDIENLLETTGVLVRDGRAPCDFSGSVPPGRTCLASGFTTPRIQLDAAVAELTEADLRVFKDCKPDEPMLVGDTATCTITVQNLGPDAALDVLAIDEYLSSGSFDFGTIITSAGTCGPIFNPQNGAGTVECDVGGMQPGTSVTITIEVTADTPQDINDLVTVSSITPDPDFNDNVAEDEVNVREIADLQVLKDCKPDEPLLAGQPGRCFITVKNWGPSTARNVTVYDAHVSNGTFYFGSVTTTQGTCTKTSDPQVLTGDVDCDLGDLASGAEAAVVVTLLPVERQNINDVAIVSGDSNDPDNTNNSARDGIGVDPVTDLALTKTATPAPVIAGTQLTYDLDVTNNGPSTAQNVVVEDVLPAGVTIDSVSSSAGSCNAGVPGDGTLPTTCTFDSLASGASATMQIVVTVEPQTLGILGNNARVYSDLLDLDNSNNFATTATTVAASADLAVSKSDYPDPVLAGENLTYDVTIQNNGPSTAVDVALTDTLPDEVSFVGYTASNGSGACVPLDGPPQAVVCDLNDLDPGEFVTVFIEVTVDPSVPDGTIILDEATAWSATTDPDPTNNTATAETTVEAEAELIITKDSNFLTDNPARRIVYNLLVTNSGPSDALDVVVVDELPLGPKKIVYVMDSGNGLCAYDASTHEVTCDFGTLPAGEAVSVDIIVDARGSVRRVTNIAHVSTSTTDPDLSSNTAIKEVRVKGGPRKKK